MRIAIFLWLNPFWDHFGRNIKTCAHKNKRGQASKQAGRQSDTHSTHEIMLSELFEGNERKIKCGLYSLRLEIGFKSSTNSSKIGRSWCAWYDAVLQFEITSVSLQQTSRMCMIYIADFEWEHPNMTCCILRCRMW